MNYANPFECCHKCVKPKRYPGCHDHCPERAKAKEEYDKLKAEEKRKNSIRNGIYFQRSANVAKAMKKHR